MDSRSGRAGQLGDSSGANANEACEARDVTVMDAVTAERLAQVCRALADPLRIRMLAAIAADPRGETCVCGLTALSDVSQPTISHHLKVLRTAGLVASERRGTWVWYRLAEAGRAELLSLRCVLGLADSAASADAHGVSELVTNH